MTAVEVVQQIKTKMEKMHTYCVIASISSLTDDRTQNYVFTADCLREEINCFWKETGIIALGLSTSHADVNHEAYSILKVTDIADTKILT